jgi:hypothetical protein
MLAENEAILLEKWMHDSEIKPGEPVKGVHFMEDTLAVDLIDGRTIVVPLARISHRTCQASEGKRQITSGIGCRRWPEGGKQSVNVTMRRIPRSVGIFRLLRQAG